MEPKEKIYLETSVINILIDPRDSRLQNITQEFWKTLKQYETYVSQTVLDEIYNTPDSKRQQQLIQIIKPFQLFETTPAVHQLVKAYLKENIIPIKYQADLYHIAVATVYNIDILASWNMKHIVKRQTRIKVNAVNKLQGYSREIDIVTPEELI